MWEKIKQFLKNNYKFLIFLVILFLLMTVQLPYVVYKPGGLVNLNDRVVLDNEENVEGSLSMCYVSMLKGTLPALGLSYIFSNWDILPEEDVTMGDESVDELLAIEKIYMDQSINNATILAYEKAGKELNITKTHHHVIYLTDEAKTDIKLGDEILKVDNKDISDINDLKKIVNSKNLNDEIEIVVLRKNKEIKTKATVYKLEDDLKIGISIIDTYEYETNPKIEVKTKNSEAGSSGGLMLSLAIYNKLTPDDITKGKKVVGTGTIDTLGQVGEIDGVKYKLLGAVKNKADIFLCPMENYDEALKVKSENNLDIIVKAVASFDEAITYLTSLEK